MPNGLSVSPSKRSPVSRTKTGVKLRKGRVNESGESEMARKCRMMATMVRGSTQLNAGKKPDLSSGISIKGTSAAKKGME